MRLATGAGHSVRVVQTPTSLRFVGKATFEGVTGAPVLVDEFEADPARGAFPGDAVPDHSAISHLELVRRCDVVLHRAGVREHHREARQRPRRQPAHERRAGLSGAARAGAGDERPHVRAPRDPGEPRAPAGARRADRAPGHGPARVEGGVGHGPAGRARGHPRGDRGDARAGPVRAALARRPAGARHRRRHARGDRLGALRRQPLVGTHGPGPGRGGRPARRRGHPDLRERDARAPARGARAGRDERGGARGRGARRVPRGRRAAHGRRRGGLPPDARRRTRRS